jgi:hypothetical protein
MGTYRFGSGSTGICKRFREGCRSDNPDDQVCSTKNNAFKFHEPFLGILKRLKNGAKFLEGVNDDFTFKWELTVHLPKEINPDLRDFLKSLNSNGTISSENPPKIEAGTIEDKKGNYTNTDSKQKKKLKNLIIIILSILLMINLHLVVLKRIYSLKRMKIRRNFLPLYVKV